MDPRGIAVGSACLALSCLPAIGVAAETYPARPIRLVASFAAGGTLDVMVRMVAQKLGEGLGATVYVDNRPGANGIVGAELVARSQPDGYTALLTTGSYAVNAAIYRQLPYDAQLDLAPVTQVARSYGLILVVHPGVAARSVKELIALARGQPGKLTFASSGIANSAHFAGEYLQMLAAIELRHVAYKSSAPAMNDLLAKRADMTFVSTVFAQPFVRNGRVHPLALTGPTRSPVLPEVQTFQEAGYPEINFTAWYGLWFSGGAPRTIVDRTHSEVAKFLATTEVKRRLEELGLVGVGSTPEEFTRFIAEDIALNRSIVARIGLQRQ